jgi:hypothetical protein
MGIDAAVSFLPVEAARGRPAAAPCAPDVGAGGGRRWPVGSCGRLGRPGGRGPVGEGRENRSAEKILGRKAGWAESDRENSFLNKI